MATQQHSSTFLSSNYLLQPSNAVPKLLSAKPDIHPPGFLKFRGLTAKKPGLKCKTVSIRRYPRPYSIEITGNSRELAVNQLFGSKNEVDDEGVPLVNGFILNRSCPYDCEQIHGYFVKLGAIKSSALVGSKLAILYLKGKGSLDDARKLFDGITERTLPLYSALIGSYCRSEKWEELFFMLEMMVLEGLLPDKYLLPTILKACSAVKLKMSGKMIHACVLRRGLGADVYVGNSLIDFYANCGDLSASRNVFNAMLERDVVSWTALVTAYMDGGLLDEAVNVFKLMQLNGVTPDLISWNALVSGFARNGEIDLAIRYLEEMEEKGLKLRVTSWNGIISGCVQNGFYDDALDMFVNMMWYPEKPNVVTMVSILPACSNLKELTIGSGIHGYALKSDLYKNVNLKGSLIDMYSKCGRTDFAEKVFLEVKTKNTAVWNEMIAAYVNEGKIEVALQLLNSMKNDGFKPDVITYNTILAGYARIGNKEAAYELLSEMIKIDLKPNIVSYNILVSAFQQSGHSYEALKLFQAMQSPSNNCFIPELLNVSMQPNPVTCTSALAACADLKFSRQGKEIHGYIVKNGFKPNVYLSSALVDMYVKSHDLCSATNVFWKIEDRNTVSWNSLIMGHVDDKQMHKALDLFQTMLTEGTKPSSITFIILFQGCADMGNLSVGRELHAYTIKSQLTELVGTLASALVDIYSKCGCIWEAKLVFESTTEKPISLWNAMMSAYSAHRMADNAIALFEQMDLFEILPDNITFAALLSAFICDGLVDEAWKYFNLMESSFGISASLEHYTCMVGILGAAGLLKDALDLIERMPYAPDAGVWVTLLKSCRHHSNPEVEDGAVKAVFELEPNNASKYVNLSNTNAVRGVWDSTKSMRS